MKKCGLHHLKNENGQVALFVALIFQVLFVFFAMIVNVGLLVHHKINLQNSVDLAAYYGAMKQAEMLNAISHVNYQMRQSWKLLAFRYQQLGTAGTADTERINQLRPPYSKLTKSILSSIDEPMRYEPYFCLPYQPVDLVQPDVNSESYCKEPESFSVPLPGIAQVVNPSIGAAMQFIDFQFQINQVATATSNLAKKYCAYATSMNWIQLGKFIWAYKMDIRNRKKLLLGLANELSKEDPRDIDGQSIREGVYQTLIRNLSYPNREELEKRFKNGVGSGNAEVDFKFINSFSEGSCGGGSPTAPPGWLKEILIYPIYALFDSTCASNSQVVNFVPSYINTGPLSVSKSMIPELLAQANQLLNVITDAPAASTEQQLMRSSLGFEKDPWCVGYVGVSAKTTPKIPFSPAGSVTLKATAFAKPFGGRVGPWYGTRWDRSASQSNDATRTDALVPVRVQMNQAVSIVSDSQKDELRKQKRLFPNYSRYLGDSIGLLSELTTGQFYQAIHTKFPRIHLNWYNHIFSQNMDSKADNGDILSWDPNSGPKQPMRDLEIAAIAPDQFDVSTYSIDPDFYNNYVKRIQKGYENQFQFLVRGDLGQRAAGSEEEKRFSVRNQINSAHNPSKNMIDVKGQLTYYLSEFGQLLTSWQQVSPDQYNEIDKTRFGKCLDPVGQDEDEKFHTSGSCKNGGRTGYSVKLVDARFLKNASPNPGSYKLGGEDTSGNLKNSPPDNF